MTSFFKKKYTFFVKKAFFFEMIGNVNRAIDVMKVSLEENFSNEEIGSAYIYIGNLYLKKNDSSSALEYFEKGLIYGKEVRYDYNTIYKKIIELFISEGKLDKADYWLTHLVKRQEYDKKFRNLTSLSTKIKV